ncbi:hypothetical protein D2Q93_04120 [Alicyclobacillaceae bacterium I2511]|nr:hypothetical protein D2Q93_04120 [Alicyclobacillaceae bacterium I2511]
MDAFFTHIRHLRIDSLKPDRNIPNKTPQTRQTLQAPSTPTRSQTGDRTSTHLWALAVLALGVTLAYPALWLPGGPAANDLTNLNVPQRLLLAWFYQHHWWPLWNPFSFGGQPFLAAGQSGPLYLPNILFLWLPVLPALKISYLGHSLLAALGTYAATYHLTHRHSAAVLAGWSFAASGFFLGHQIHTQMFDAMCWLPVCFWLALRVLDQPRLRRVLVLSLCLAMEIYAGHPQITFFTGLTVGLFALLYEAMHPSWSSLRRLGSLLGAAVLGLGLSAPQWLLTLNLVTYSDRSQASPSFLLKGSLPPSGLLQWLTPFASGGGYVGAFSRPLFNNIYHMRLFWEFTCYAGVIVLVFAITATLVQFFSNHAVRSLAIVGLLAVALSLGANTPLATVLTQWPGFDLFRIPARYGGIVDFCVAVLAGIGVDLLFRRPQLAGWVTAGVAATLAAVLTAARKHGPLQLSPQPAITAAWVWLASALLLGLLVALAGTFVRDPRARLAQYAGRLLMVLAGLDVLSQAATFSPWVYSAHPRYLHPGPLVTFVQKHLSGTPFNRIAALYEGPLQLDRNLPWHIASINGYDSLVPTWYVTHVNLTWSPDVLLQQPVTLLNSLGVRYLITHYPWENPLPRQSQGQPAWQQTLTRPPGATALVIHTQAALQQGNLQAGYLPLLRITVQSNLGEISQVFTGLLGDSFVLALPGQWHLVSHFTVRLTNESWNTAVQVSSLGFIGQHTLSKFATVPVQQLLSNPPWKMVFSSPQGIIWENPNKLYSAWVSSGSASLGNRQPGIVHLAHWTPNNQVWQLTVPATDGPHPKLILSQTYDPNWHATLDGKPVPVQAAGASYGNLLTSIPVSSGRHTLILTYWPRAFTLGWTIAAASGTVSLCFLGWSMWQTSPKSRRVRKV